MLLNFVLHNMITSKIRVRVKCLTGSESAGDKVQILTAQSQALQQILLNSVLHRIIPPKFR